MSAAEKLYSDYFEIRPPSDLDRTGAQDSNELIINKAGNTPAAVKKIQNPQMPVRLIEKSGVPVIKGQEALAKVLSLFKEGAPKDESLQAVWGDYSRALESVLEALEQGVPDEESINYDTAETALEYLDQMMETPRISAMLDLKKINDLKKVIQDNAEELPAWAA